MFFRCSRVHDISEDEKGDQGGSPKNGQNIGWVKPDIFKRAAQNGQNFGWGEKSRFWASSSQKSALKQLKNWGRPKIGQNFGWSKNRTSLKLPRSPFSKGIKVLGTPIGHPRFRRCSVGGSEEGTRGVAQQNSLPSSDLQLSVVVSGPLCFLRGRAII